MREIALTRGQVALVDDEDYDWLNRHSWHALLHKSGTFYAKRVVRMPNGKLATLWMARQILGEPSGLVDHKNRNTLDNRRINLREATHLQNILNRGKQKPACHSQYRGVSRRLGTDEWRATARLGSKRHHLGYFADEETAAAAYRLTIETLHGDFACFEGLPDHDRSVSLMAAEAVRKARITEERLESKASRYPGVRTSTANGWEARISINGISVSLGWFADEETAGAAYRIKFEESRPGVTLPHGVPSRERSVGLLDKLKSAREARAARRTSRFSGVTFHKASGKWQAQLRLGGGRRYSRIFQTEVEAAQAVEEQRRLLCQKT